MAIFRGLFVRKDATRGTTPNEARKALAGLFDAFGVLVPGSVTGTAGWAYLVSSVTVAASRQPSDGAVLYGNYGAVTVGTNGVGDTIPPAPGTGSRIDIIYALHRDVDNADADSEAIIAVASGTASGSPVAPSIPTGGVELARATVAAGATNTAHANVTISAANRPTARLRGTQPPEVFTAPDGGWPNSLVKATSGILTQITIPSATFARTVDVDVVVSASVGAGEAWEVRLTSSLSTTPINSTNPPPLAGGASALAPFASGVSVGGSTAVHGTLTIAAGVAQVLRVWAIGSGTFNPTGTAFTQLRVRAYPA
ncbi:hypothetical protein [Occultella gossypii]|uniref:Minor tail protein n=1 Tax=Occultella gossypii TaxID=2800820 RepID=A0ABS7SAA9_9MICO|nr:hypothetical protein [Occultella gossypii]MBZ2197283.1 hypothetical protein [Occultella gossypii]